MPAPQGHVQREFNGIAFAALLANQRAVTWPCSFMTIAFAAAATSHEPLPGRPDPRR